MNIDLSGRTALITGGSMGLGRAMSLKMAAAGANVVIVARRQEHIDEAVQQVRAQNAGKAHGISCDVTDPSAIEDCYKEAVATFGQVDILVNNAGSSLRGPFLEMTDDQWKGDI